MLTLNRLNQLDKTGWTNPWDPEYKGGVKLQRYLRLRGECPGQALLAIRHMILE